MEKVINVLYEIEEKANRILERTTEQKKQLQQKLNSELDQLDEAIKTDTNKKLVAMKDAMEEQICKERAKLNDDCNAQLTALEDKFASEHDTLVNQMFKKIASF